MTLVAVPGGIWWPPPKEGIINVSGSSVLLDANGEKAGVVFQAVKTGTISKVGFRTQTVTTGATMDVRLETVGTDGFPTGTLFGTNTNGSQAIGNADDGTWFLTTLTSGAAVTAGDFIAAVIVNPTGGNWNLTRYGDVSFIETQIPYSVHFTSSWAVLSLSSGDSACFAFEYNDGSYSCIPGIYPASGFGTGWSYANDSTPDERGIIFQVPFKCRVFGAWLFAICGAAEDYSVRLYDSDGSTLLANTGTLDADKAGNVGNVCKRFVVFPSPATLSTGVNYRLTLRPETTGNIDLYYATVSLAAQLDSWPGGQTMHLTTRTDGGSWTETTTIRPFMGLLIDQLDDGVGGGLITHPGMVGGMRG